MTLKPAMDLNDLHYFAVIVDAGSLSAASRVLGITKSSLSQRLARLEQTLGVRLIQRNTRKLVVTPVGVEFHRRCRRVLAEADFAKALIDETLETPRGTLKVNCPVTFAQFMLGPVLGEFMRAHPEVDLILDATYRDVDLIAEGYDLSIIICPDLRDSPFVVRSFPLDQPVLVASANFLRDRAPFKSPHDLHDIPSVWLRDCIDPTPNWLLIGPEQRSHRAPHRPRFSSADPMVVKQGVLADAGVALLPKMVCREELESGRIVQILPEWRGTTRFLHAIYPSRQGLSLIARRFIELLSDRLMPRLLRSNDGSLLDLSPAPERLRGDGMPG